MKRELISVLMAVHNEKADFLKEAIESIINQTYGNFEFIIVDDDSDEPTKHILEQYCVKDSRICIIHNEENMGLTKSLNRAYHASHGEYLARMDADDISVRNRFQLQYEWMNSHPEISVLGGINIDFDTRTYHHGYLSDNMERLKIRLLFNNVVFGHPTAFIRRSFLEEHGLEYDETLKKSQDYGLWVDVIKNSGIVQSIPKILILKRKHANQISVKNKDEQMRSAIEIRRRLWNYYGFELSREELLTIINLVSGKYSKEKTFKTIDKIIHEKSKLNKYQNRYLEEELMYYYWKSARKTKKAERYGISEEKWRKRIFIPQSAIYLLKRVIIEQIKINMLIRRENEIISM